MTSLGTPRATMETVDVNRNKRPANAKNMHRIQGAQERPRETSSPRISSLRTTKTSTPKTKLSSLTGKAASPTIKTSSPRMKTTTQVIQSRKQVKEERKIKSVDSATTDQFRNRDEMKEFVILSYLTLPDTEQRKLTRTVEGLNVMISCKKQKKRLLNNRKVKGHSITTKTAEKDDSGKKKHAQTDVEDPNAGSMYVPVPGARHEQWTGILESLIIISAAKQFCSYMSTVSGEDARLHKRKRILSESRRVPLHPPAHKAGTFEEARRVVIVPKKTYQQWCTVLEAVRTAIEEMKKYLSSTKRKGHGAGEDDRSSGTRFKTLPKTIYHQWYQSVENWNLAMTQQQTENNMAALYIPPGNDQSVKSDRRDVRKPTVLPKNDTREEIVIPIPLPICQEWETLLKNCKINVPSKASISRIQAKKFTSLDKAARKLNFNDQANEEYAQNKPPTSQVDPTATDSQQTTMTVPEAAYNEWRKLLDAWDVMMTSLGYRQCQMSVPKLPEVDEGHAHSDDQSEIESEEKLKKIILLPKSLHDQWFKALDAWNTMASTLGYGENVIFIQRLNLWKMVDTAFTARRRRVCMSYIETTDDNENFIGAPELVMTDWLQKAHNEWSNILQNGHAMMMAHGYEEYKASMRQLLEFKDHVYGYQGGGTSNKPPTEVERVYLQWVKLRDSWNSMVTAVGHTTLIASIPSLQGLQKNFKRIAKDSYASETDPDVPTENGEDSGPVMTLVPVNMYQMWDTELESWSLKVMRLGDEFLKQPTLPSQVMKEILRQQQVDDQKINSKNADVTIDNTLLIPRTNHHTWSKVLDDWNEMMTDLDYVSYMSKPEDTAERCTFSNARQYDHRTLRYLKMGLKTPLTENKTYHDKWAWVLDAWGLIVSLKQRERCIKFIPEIQAVNRKVIARLPITFGKRGSKQGMFVHPCGVIINNHGKMVICDKDNNRIQVMDRRGLSKVTAQFKKFLRPFMPYDIAESPDGKYFITDISNNQIVVCNEYDQVLRIFGNKEGLVPRGIIVTPLGQVLVTDVQEGRSCIRKYTLDGRHLGEFATYSANRGQIQYPCSLTVNSKGHVIVPGNGRSVIQTYESNGKLKSTFSTASAVVTPYGIDVDEEDNIYVCDFWNDRLVKYTSTGHFLYTIGQGQLKGPMGVAVVNPFVIAVTEHQSHQVVVLNL